MKLIQRIFAAHLAIGVAALAVGLSLSGSFLPAALGLFIGAFWFFSMTRNNHGLETFYLLTLLLIASAGFYWFAIVPALALLSAVAVLGAWDLDHFLQRMRAADRVDRERGLGGSHIRRLLSAEGVGLLLGGLTLVIRTSWPFWLTILLVMVGVVGISQLVKFVRNQAE